MHVRRSRLHPRAGIALVLLLWSLRDCGDATAVAVPVGVGWWVVPTTIRVPQNATPPGSPHPRPGSQLHATAAAGDDAWDFTAISVDAARGETERVQVALSLPTSQHAVNVSLAAADGDHLRDTTAGIKRDAVTSAPGLTRRSAPWPTLEWSRVVAVYCNESAFYTLPPGWYPDATVPSEQWDRCPDGAPCFDAAGGMTHSIIVAVVVAEDVSPGNYTSLLNVTVDGSTAASIPVHVRVWDVTIPDLATSRLPTIFAFPYRTDINSFTASDLGAYYGHPGALPDELKRDYFTTMCSLRAPPDNPYLLHPQLTGDIELAEDPSVCSGGDQRFALINVADAAGNKLNYTASELAAVVAEVEPIVQWTRAHNLSHRAYMYGFDEAAQSYVPAIGQLFGALKVAYPDIRTIATLRWTPPDDLPIDTWVQLYSLWNDTAAAQWKAAKPRMPFTARAGGVDVLPRETWAYWCISPRPPAAAPHYTPGHGWLNTFVEYPAVGARYLPWWAALRAGSTSAVDGWLYYSVDSWSPGNQHKALAADSSSRTSFSAVRYNGKLHGFSNGDGILLYPAARGPAPSIRLLNWADGAEDYELLAAAAAEATVGPDKVQTLVRALVRSGTDYEVDTSAAGPFTAALTLRDTRRELLALLAQH